MASNAGDGGAPTPLAVDLFPQNVAEERRYKRSFKLSTNLTFGFAEASAEAGREEEVIRYEPSIVASGLLSDEPSWSLRSGRALRLEGVRELFMIVKAPLEGSVQASFLVDAEVLNVSIVKPLHSETILESLSKTGLAVTAEEHRVVGGLADAVRQVAAEQHPVPIFAVGMGDEFGISGTGEACMEHFGLTARGIADRAREAMVLKPIVSRPPLFGPEWT